MLFLGIYGLLHTRKCICKKKKKHKKKPHTQKNKYENSKDLHCTCDEYFYVMREKMCLNDHYNKCILIIDVFPLIS